MHYDMDAFFASVEIAKNPKLKDRALVVGKSIVTTASYPARVYGIHSAMRVSDAKKLCPNLIIIPGHKEEYIEISNRIKNLVLKITNKVEFISLDEGYIDLTGIVDEDKKENFAKKFKKRIKELTNLTCSVGVGFNKLSAKIASDINKPYGMYIFNNQREFSEYIRNKKISIIPGVGKKFNELLNADDIFFVKDVEEFSLEFLVNKYGNHRGKILYYSSRGIDDDAVEYERKVHSIGNEETFLNFLTNEEELKREFYNLFEYSFERLSKKKLYTQSIVIKIKYDNFELVTKSKKLKEASNNKKLLLELAEELLSYFYDVFDENRKIRLLGIYFSEIKEEKIFQLKFKCME